MNKKIKTKTTKVLLTVLNLCIFFGILFSATPTKVNYQGVLKERGQLITGMKKMKFSIYDSAVGGNLKWTSGVVKVEVKSGVFSYVLNLPSDFDWNKGTYYLEVEVEGQVLSPREEIASSVYSIHAKEAEIASEAKSVDWSDIKNKPPEFSGGELSANSIGSYHIIDSTITDADISPQANISWSKISKSGSSLGDLGGILPPDKLSGSYLNDVKVSSAIHAEVADSVVGSVSSEQDLDMRGHNILNLSTITAQSEGIYLATNVFVTQGNVGIGTMYPSSKLNVVGKTILDINDASEAPLVVNQSGSSWITAFYQSWNPKVVIDNSGNVGIGNTTPAARLDVQGSDMVAPLRLSTGSAAGSEVMVVQSNGNVGIGTTEPTGKLSVQGTGTSYGLFVSTDSGGSVGNLVVNNAGNVGIGTTTPDQALVIDKSGNDVPRLVLNFSDASGHNSGLVFRKDGTFKGGLFIEQGNSNISIWSVNTSSVPIPYLTVQSGTGNVGIGTTAPGAKLEVKQAASNTYAVKVSSNDGTAMAVITNQGNVGIGTTAPTYKLDVTGDIHSTTGITSDGTFAFIIGTTGFAYLPSNTSHIAYYKKSGTYEYYWRKSDNGYPGGANEATLAALNDNGRFYVSGNVGIGTTAPQMTLHVKSSSTTSGVRVDAPSSQQVGYQWAKDGSIKWSAYIDVNSNDLRFWDGIDARVTFASGGNVGIGTTNPDRKLDVNGGAVIRSSLTVVGTAGFSGNVVVISTGTTNLFRFQSDGRAKSLVSFDAGGADYAEWFEKEEEINPGDIVGLNLETGKARKYRSGDVLLGICSSNPGFVGNSDINKSDEEIKKNYVLVGLVGQLDFNKEQVMIIGRKVETKDGKQIGYLLSNGKVLLKMQ